MVDVTPFDTQVLVVGAGPVGMTLALDLAARDIDVTIVEQRAPGDPADAKCNTVASRTLEVFRRLGFADDVRGAGLGDDYPTDAVFRTALTGPDFFRINLPSRSERLGADGRSAPGYLDSDWRTPEPVVRVSQLFLDPLLRDKVEKSSRIRLVPSTAFERFEDGPDGVEASCRDLDQDRVFKLRARFLVGADGGTSAVRKQLDVDLLGDAEINRTRSSLIRTKDILPLFKGRPAWMTWVISHKIVGVVVAIDGEELWLLHRGLRRGMSDFSELDADQSIRDLVGVDDSFQYEVVANQDWVGRRLVAERFRKGHVFLSGDAAHLWVPLAGYGMNAGIADAMNLSWMLAAVLQGWAPESLLDAHERERHPITEQVSKLAMKVAEELAEKASGRSIPKAMSQRGPIGALLRRAITKRIRSVNEDQFACEGLNFGYYYDDSPILHYDGDSAPSYTMGSSVPSTVPGCRMPHFWLDGQTSLYDRLGPWFTLVRFDPSVDAAAAINAARESEVPLELLDVPVQSEPEIFRHKLVLVRPDQHVAWRGDRLPEALGPWLDHVCGRS